ELFRSFASRSPTRLFWEVGPFTNLRLLGVVVASVLIQIGIHHIPVLEDLFQISDLSTGDCAVTLLLGLIPVTCIELGKLIARIFHARPGHLAATPGGAA
ncbi:MAG TPA: cation-translocating P-type ATPase C-terminal domain-containing protein, partial [Polyangia bacterium]